MDNLTPIRVEQEYHGDRKMSPSKREKAIASFRNPRFWLAVLVLGVVSGLVACVVGRLWGETAGFYSFFFTTVLIPGLLGVDGWINDYPNGGKESGHSLDRPV
jgi:hypothetical protein